MTSRARRTESKNKRLHPRETRQGQSSRR
jgi:hypothetical protein